MTSELGLNFFMSLLGTLLLSKVRRHGVPSDPFHVTLLKNYFVISIKSLINNSLVKCVCLEVGGRHNCRDQDTGEKTLQSYKAKVKR